MTKLIINVGLLVSFIFSILFGILYFGLLYDKITKPNFKNIGTEGFLWLGLLMGLFITADFFILIRLLKRLKK